MQGISIVVPAKNEEGNIKALAKRVHAALSNQKIPYELIIIDDRSADGTVRVVQEMSKIYPVCVYPKQGANGKARALIEGFAHAQYDFIAIIDADLQYPPEKIPEMIEKIDSGSCDIVVANRREQNISFVRRFFSKGFSFVFAKLLHGFDCDVQSGLKVFRKKILFEITLNHTPWTFDLGFLINAQHAGYQIGTVDISFSERSTGESKVKLLKASWEIGWNAILLKFKPRKPIAINPDGEGMIGAGLAHQKKRFITHTTLSHHISAIETFMLWQKILLWIFVFLVVGCFIIWPLKTGVVLVAILSCIYFADVVFNFYIVYKSLTRPPEISVTDTQLAELDEASLPMYTVLCPLYRESHMIPAFVEGISKLDWPKDKLDAILLLEENDPETIAAAQAMDLPPYVRALVVPHSLPKTKPKACNYGLHFSKGEYLVVYDAEDIPDPKQLKKAYYVFQHSPSSIKCLQAKLNYYNPHQNFLTRFFTAEYSLWFDITLPGLQSVNAYIPLGGTSNHFRTEDLKMLKGWDPFNVTEDCDLGARIFLSGYSTAVIDSVTLEEANSNAGNWIRQRSRWIKGYMQTYLVHMRNPFKFFKENGIKQGLIFQLVVGGKIGFLIINPILWLATILYFAFYSVVGPTIEALYPPVVLYLAVTSLVFGNFLFLYYYMIGAAKREHWSIIKYVMIIPIYWFMASFAALIAAYQLFVKPHYWEKTKHGLHLASIPVHAGPIKLEPQKVVSATSLPWRDRIRANSIFSQGSALIIAMMIANVLNLLFSAFLGRTLSLNDLGLVTIVNTIWSVAGILIGGVSATINHKTAYLSGKEEVRSSIHFWKTTLRLATVVSLVASVAWIVAIPFLSNFFHIQNIMVLLLFTPTLTFGVVAAANRGFLQGNLMFKSVAVITIVEAIAKLFVAILFIQFGFHGWVFIAIPISIFATAVAGSLLSRHLSTKLLSPETTIVPYEFPKFFYAASIMSSISSAIFLSVDIILVKHYFDPIVAGEYSLLALIGKMVYFLGSLSAVFMITFVSRAQGLGKDPKKTFQGIFLVTLAMVMIGFLGLAFLGSQFVPLVWGSKTLTILPYIRHYAFAISLFTLANVIVSYHLAKKQYIFPAASLIGSALMAIGIINYHDSIGSIVQVISVASIFNFSLMALMHMFEARLVFVSSNIIDFFEAFVRRPVIVRPIKGRRILVFNWRDTRHIFTGGAEVYIQEIAKRFVTQGDHVTLFCGNDGRSPRNETVDGINVIRRGGFYFVYAWAFLYYFTQFRGKYDVIIDCHNGIPFFTPMYVKEPIICVVFHVHQEVFRRSLPFPLAQLACSLERDMMPLVYRNTHFVTISSSSKKEMINYGLVGKGIEIVYSGVDLKAFQPAEKSSIPMVLYLGRLKAYKSIDVLITAFRLLIEQVPHAILVIAGKGEEEKHLKRLVRQLDLESKVKFTGEISEEDKIKLFQKAWVMVNPSFMEGWGITTIEANACGTPVIGANVAGLRDSIKDFETGYLVTYGDSQAFADKIKEIMMDRGLRNKMAKESRQWAQNFSWSSASSNFSTVINENYKT